MRQFRALRRLRDAAAILPRACYASRRPGFRARSPQSALSLIRTPAGYYETRPRRHLRVQGRAGFRVSVRFRMRRRRGREQRLLGRPHTASRVTRPQVPLRQDRRPASVAHEPPPPGTRARTAPPGRAEALRGVEFIPDRRPRPPPAPGKKEPPRRQPERQPTTQGCRFGSPGPPTQ